MSARTNEPGRPSSGDETNEGAHDLAPAGSDPSLRTHTLPGRRYRVLMELGRGGMGVVQLAMSRGPRDFIKLIVLKSLHAHLAHDAHERRRLLDEARIAARLSHPNIVQVYEVIVEQPVPMIVMEYLEGRSLWEVAHECEARLPLPVRVHVLAQVLCGLQAAHVLRDFGGAPLDIVHRDVSPHNVFLLYDGQVKLLDFGIAKTSRSEVETRPGIARGKLQYMAPEQLRGEEVDLRADVFSVGVMLYEPATGERLWRDAADGAVALRLLQRDVPELTDPHVSAGLRAIVNRALAADPEQRYSSALEFQNALEAELAGHDARVLREQLAEFVSQHFAEARRAREQLVRSHVVLASERPPPPAHAEAVSSPPGPSRRRTRASVALIMMAVTLLAAVALLALRSCTASPPSSPVRGPLDTTVSRAR
jgi:serine/threonine-protein kinase